jgi:hypothetical protein
MMDSRLRIRTADTLPLPLLESFPIKSGRFHEWFLKGDFPAGAWWSPPLTIMAAVAFRTSQNEERPRHVVWVGRKCWPVFQLPCGMGAEFPGKFLNRSVFLDPQNDAERFWVIGQALRCPGVHAVIADGSGMTQTISRRLQLAAEAGMAMGLIARPWWEAEEPSYAETRWEVRPRSMGGMNPGWAIELMSCRGQRARQDVPQNWNAEWIYQVFCGTGTLDFSPVMGRGAGASPLRDARSRTA